MITLDEQLRPTWLFSETLHQGCDRGGYYEQGEFADTYGAKSCTSNLAAGGRSSNATSASVDGWAGIGGCPNVGGICIGCTMPGFPDKFMPFMDQPPGSMLYYPGDSELRQGNPRAALLHAGFNEQGTVVAGPVRGYKGKMIRPEIPFDGDAVETLLGYTANEWAENPIFRYQRLHPDDRQRWNEEFSRTVSSTEPFRGDYRFLSRDGRVGPDRWRSEDTL